MWRVSTRERQDERWITGGGAGVKAGMGVHPDRSGERDRSFVRDAVADAEELRQRLELRDRPIDWFSATAMPTERHAPRDAVP